MKIKCVMCLCALLYWVPAYAERIKDLVSIQGVRSNQLVGYGLVVGLEGTGDSEVFTRQSFRNMLNRLGVTLPTNVTPSTKNVAAVALHASLPAFAKPGQKIDVTVSSIGNAKSLRGGSLLFAPLKGADGNVYAIAQGDLVVGGVSAEGGDGSKVNVNLSLVGRIPNGAMIEKGIPSPFVHTESIILNLNAPDFTTAKRLAEEINHHFCEDTAIPLDATSIRVNMPSSSTDRIAFVSKIENLHIRPGDLKAKIIMNARTGTVVISKHVTVGPAAVAHGNIVVTVTEHTQVSQPNELSRGVTTVTTQSDVAINQANNRMFLVEGVSLNSIVNAINKVGTPPSDLMVILEALKQAGALNADLEII